MVQNKFHYAITGQTAAEIAEREYDEFNKTQKIISDFEKEVKKLMERGESCE